MLRSSQRKTGPPATRGMAGAGGLGSIGGISMAYGRKAKVVGSRFATFALARKITTNARS